MGVAEDERVEVVDWVGEGVGLWVIEGVNRQLSLRIRVYSYTRMSPLLVIVTPRVLSKRAEDPAPSRNPESEPASWYDKESRREYIATACQPVTMMMLKLEDRAKVRAESAVPEVHGRSVLIVPFANRTYKCADALSVKKI